MELKYFVIIMSIVLILFLYALSTLSQPVLIELNQINEYEGKQVIVIGRVIEHYTTAYGNQIITIKGEGNEEKIITIFVEDEVAIEYGDIIQATGKVQKYKDEWEIIVNNRKYITILQKWTLNHFPLWQLASDPDHYIGMNVNVTGFVERMYDSFFYLVDLD